MHKKFKMEAFMKRAAKVKFIGDSDYYKLGCGQADENWLYCKDCANKECSLDTPRNFITGNIYNAYFLEYWQGVRDSLHVKGENGIICDFLPLSSFEIIEDHDNVLNTNEATLECVIGTNGHDLTVGKTYKAIGYNKKGAYLVMNDSGDCYFYPPKDFKILNDPFGVLNPDVSEPVYDFKNFDD